MRNQNVLASFRRAGSHPLVWIAVAAFIAWRGYTAYSPHVVKVERSPDGLLIISGRNFGAARGDSALVYNAGDKEIEIEVNEWGNDRIIAHLLGGQMLSGTVIVKRAFWNLYWPSSEAALVIPEQGLPSQPFGYGVPAQAAAPWPTFRRNRKNSGYLPVPAVYDGDTPWSFQTGKGIAAAPVIDAQGVAYVGSADHTFYAINPDGSERWRYRTGGVIRSSAALLRPQDAAGAPSVVVGSGDGFLYRLRTASEARNQAAREMFAFDARVLGRSGDDNWFEGDVAIGFDGTLFAGNGNSNFYAVTPKGELKWAYPAEGMVWSNAAFGSDGTILWGAQDGSLHSLNPNGTAKWTKTTWGPILAAAAVGSDETVYVGSFDGNLYALDPDDGATRWTFETGDHLVGSVGLGENATGSTDAIYLGSTDGRMYAVNPKGELMWKYDTGDPIRSSPAVGLGPRGEHAGIVYFGSGNGKVYALNAIDGQRRWSFDTSAGEADLRDRNDVNSIALGTKGVYAGSESGHLWYVPYDYCLHADDARCSTAPGEDLPQEIAGLAYISPGGTTYFDQPPPILPASVITLRLVVRNRQRTIDAHLCNTPLLCSARDLRIEAEPPFAFRTEQSADGRFVHIVPENLLDSGTTYRLRVEGDYYTGGYHVGRFTVGGSRAGHFNDGITLRTQASAGPSPLIAKGEEVPAFEWTRLAVSVPSMIASVDQTAFDDIDLILGAVGVRPTGDGAGKLIVWGIGGERDSKGTLVADPDSAVTLALSGSYDGDSFALIGHGISAKVGSASIPFDQLEIRGRLDSDLSVASGASLFIVADPSSIPTVGSYLATDAANAVFGPVAMTGTYLTRPYPRGGPANKRPRGLQVSFVEFVPPTERLPGQVVAHFRLARGARYKLAEHRVGIVLIDRVTDKVVPLDYATQITASATPQGDVSQVVLTIPEGSDLSQELSVLVVADVFPLHREKLENRPQTR